MAHDSTDTGNICGGASSNSANTQQLVRRGAMRGWRNPWRVRFSGLNVAYDEEGYDYPVDNEGRLHLSLDPQTLSPRQRIKEMLEKIQKSSKDYVLVWSLLVPKSAKLI